VTVVLDVNVLITLIATAQLVFVRDLIGTYHRR
jgi:hypothetical protein